MYCWYRAFRASSAFPEPSADVFTRVDPTLVALPKEEADFLPHPRKPELPPLYGREKSTDTWSGKAKGVCRVSDMVTRLLYFDRPNPSAYRAFSI